MKSLERMKEHPLYDRYRHMRAACTLPKCPDYVNVGAKGISMDPRWFDFWHFAKDIETKLGLPRSHKDKLARKNQKKDFTLNNLEWATSKVVGRRCDRTIRLTYQGKTRCVKEWSEITGIKFGTLISRIRLGWTTAQILGYKPGPRQLSLLRKKD